LEEPRKEEGIAVKRGIIEEAKRGGSPPSAAQPGAQKPWEKRNLTAGFMCSPPPSYPLVRAEGEGM